MKILKILLLFLCLAGVMVGILFFVGRTSDDEAHDYETNPLFQTNKERISRDWAATHTWNDTLYEKHVELLRQNEISLGGGYKTLMETTNELACERLDSLMMLEFSKPDCNTQTVKALKRGLDRVLSNATELSEDARVKKMQGTYALYVKLLDFASNRFNLSTRFAYSNNSATWNSFSAHAANVRSTRDKFKRDPYYPNLQNVTTVKTGLSSVDGKLAAARKTFADALAADIVRHFSALDHAEHGEQLQGVYMKYTNEGYNNARLTSFVRSY